jgi:GAF domain-containing protein/HAMP domain-containing protein
MKWWHNRSIRFKAITGIGLILSPVLVAIIFAITSYAQRELWQREVLEAESLNAIASTLVSDAMMEGRKDKVQETLVKLGSHIDGQFDSIAVYDDQSVLTSYATGFPGGRALDKNIYEVDTSDPTCWVCHQLPAEERPAMTVVSVDGQDVLRSVVPLYNEPRCQVCHGTGLEVLGDSIVDLRLERFQQSSQTVALGLGGSILAAVALLILISYQFTRRVIILPLENLVDVSKEIMDGSFDRQVEVHTEDEIGQLGKAFNDMAMQVRGFVQTLEDRVAERTTELEQASHQVQYRAKQFESIAQVSRVISSIQNQEELLRRITRMISQYFGFYHVGVFLLSDDRQFAVLRAANSEGGQQMLERGHRLEVGQTGIVGFVTSTGNPRIALDTGTDAVYFDNPDLPNTRSEMALPLKVSGRVVGALDVQSTESNAFTSEDINILSALADQVSAAMENVRLHEETQEALAKAEAASRQLTGRAWADIQRVAPVAGYRYDGTKAEPLKVSTNGEQAKPLKEAFSVPVQLRGESIGSLRIKPTADGHQWSEDEIAIIQATAERVALAIENARLVSESQKNASKEQVIGEASSRISSAINLDNILQTALREMGRIIPGADISIQIENE